MIPTLQEKLEQEARSIMFEFGVSTTAFEKIPARFLAILQDEVKKAKEEAKSEYIKTWMDGAENERLLLSHLTTVAADIMDRTNATDMNMKVDMEKIGKRLVCDFKFEKIS